MKILTKLLPFMAENKGDEQLNKALAPVISGVTWVLTALGIIGTILITISLVKVGIKLSNADSPEAAQKCKKQVVYCIIGLVLCLGASIAIPFIGEAVKAWATENFVDTALVVKTF